MEGWIKLHRKIRENTVFSDMHLFRLWIICLTEATHKEREQLIGKQIVHLLPGEFVTGRFDLHAMFNKGLKPKERVTEYTVWRWILTLQELEFLSIKSSNKFSIVTVVKWSEYQSSEHENEQQMSNKRATDEQQMSTNKNVKNDKNEKNVKKETPNKGAGYTPEFEEFFSVYPRAIEKKATFSTWKTAIKSEEPSVIILCASNYAKNCEMRQTDTEFIKHPSTFLNKERYKEYLVTVAGGSNDAEPRRSPPRRDNEYDRLSL